MKWFHLFPRGNPAHQSRNFEKTRAVQKMLNLSLPFSVQTDLEARRGGPPPSPAHHRMKWFHPFPRRSPAHQSQNSEKTRAVQKVFISSLGYFVKTLFGSQTWGTPQFRPTKGMIWFHCFILFPIGIRPIKTRIQRKRMLSKDCLF